MIEAQLERIATALEGILATLQSFVPEPEPPSEIAQCQHPIDERIDFGTTNGQPDFQCRLCGCRTGT